MINYPETDRKVGQGEQGQRHVAPTTRLFFMAANTKTGPLADKRIRQAVSLAIDRDVIVDVALGGVGGTRAQSIFPSVMSAWVNPNLKLPYDPVRARRPCWPRPEPRGRSRDGMLRLNGVPLVLKLAIHSAPVQADQRDRADDAAGRGRQVEIEWASTRPTTSRSRPKIDLHLRAWGTRAAKAIRLFPRDAAGRMPVSATALLEPDAGRADGQGARRVQSATR